MKAYALRFFLRKSSGNDSLSKLFARITVDGKRVDLEFHFSKANNNQSRYS